MLPKKFLSYSRKDCTYLNSMRCQRTIGLCQHKAPSRPAYKQALYTAPLCLAYNRQDRPRRNAGKTPLHTCTFFSCFAYLFRMRLGTAVLRKPFFPAGNAAKSCSSVFSFRHFDECTALPARKTSLYDDGLHIFGMFPIQPLAMS